VCASAGLWSQGCRFCSMNYREEQAHRRGWRIACHSGRGANIGWWDSRWNSPRISGASSPRPRTGETSRSPWPPLCLRPRKKTSGLTPCFLLRAKRIREESRSVGALAAAQSVLTRRLRRRIIFSSSEEVPHETPCQSSKECFHTL